MDYRMTYGATEQDIEAVLRQNIAGIADPGGKPVALMATEIYAGFDTQDHDRITQAAASAGTDGTAQSDGARDEIRAILIERGILKPGAAFRQSQ